MIDETYYQRNREKLLINQSKYDKAQMSKCNCGEMKSRNSKSCHKCHGKKPFGTLSRNATIKQLNKQMSNQYG